MPLLLFLSFLAIPVAEIYVIIQIGGLVGTWPTVALLVADSLLGAWIVRREGIRAWRNVQETFQAGRMPDRELADAAMILVGGALLLTPGFITDVSGLTFVLPFTRPAVRRMVVALTKQRLEARMHRYPPTVGSMGWGRPGQQGTEGRQGAEGQQTTGRQARHGDETSGQQDGTYGSKRVVRGDVIGDED